MKGCKEASTQGEWLQWDPEHLRGLSKELRYARLYGGKDPSRSCPSKHLSRGQWTHLRNNKDVGEAEMRQEHNRAKGQYDFEQRVLCELNFILTAPRCLPF